MLKLIFFQLDCKNTTLFSHTLIYKSFYDLLTRKNREFIDGNRRVVAYLNRNIKARISDCLTSSVALTVAERIIGDFRENNLRDNDCQ